MVLIDPRSPVYNTIIFYIMIVCLILIMKPSFMYCDKTKRFRPFGCNETENQTLLSFPIVSLGAGIALYILFLFVDIFFRYLEK